MSRWFWRSYQRLTPATEDEVSRKKLLFEVSTSNWSDFCADRASANETRNLSDCLINILHEQHDQWFQRICDKMQIWQNANVTKRQKQTKCQPDKMQTRQNAKVTKCKWDKLQM